MKHPITISFLGVPGCGKSTAMKFLETKIAEMPVGKPHFVILKSNHEQHEMVIDIVDAGDPRPGRPE